MSRETTLIVLGVLIMALRTLMGLPGTWQTAALVLMGGAVAMIGFLLRGESLARGVRRRPHDSYAESRPEEPAPTQHTQPTTNESTGHGIGSLN